MSIVVPADFVGDVNIPNSGDTYLGTSSNVQFFIDKYTPIFLESLLGYDLYQEYLIGITPVPVEPATDPVTYEPINPKWINIQTIAKPLLLNYIYYWFKRNEYSYGSGSGESQAKGENATMVSPGFKMQTRWNEMVKWVYKIVRYWDVDAYGEYYIKFRVWGINDLNFEVVYPYVYQRCAGCLPDIFFTINTMGI